MIKVFVLELPAKDHNGLDWSSIHLTRDGAEKALAEYIGNDNIELAYYDIVEYEVQS